MSETKEPIIASKVVAQVGVIVRDIETKAKNWAELFGMPVPEIKMTDTYEVTRAEHGGKPTQARAKLAFFNFDNIQIELIEPVGEPSTWNDQLQAHGESLHHLAFRVGSVPQMMEVLPKLESEGLKLVQRGDWKPDGRYLYMDGADKLGAILELLPGKP